MAEVLAYDPEVCLVDGCNTQHFPDLPLLRKVVDHIKADPDSWEQGNWAVRWLKWTQPRDQKGRFGQGQKYQTCGTAMCVAGHAASLGGFQIAWDPNADYANNVKEKGKDGGIVSIPEAARHALGLTRSEASMLFRGRNNLGDVLRVCQRIAARVGEEF